MVYCIPSGKSLANSAIFCLTPVATSNKLEPEILLIPNATAGFPRNLAIVRSLSAPISALPISLKRICPPSSVLLITKSSYSSEDNKRPKVLTGYSVFSPSILPLGISTFCCLNARSTSKAVMFIAAIFFGSSQSRIA